MRTPMLVVTSLMLLSCESKPTAPPESKKPKQEAGVIAIDAAAQKKGGIIVEEAQLRTLAETITASGQLTVADLLVYARNTLPAYMVPAAFEILDALPRTSTDKIDYQALKAQVLQGTGMAGAPDTGADVVPREFQEQLIV